MADVEQIVLVVAGQDDLMSDKIILGVTESGADAIRLDPSTAPLRIECTLTNGTWQGTIQAGDGRPIWLEHVGAVVWRWGGKLSGHPSIVDADERAWAACEDTEAVLGVLRSLPVYWMSHPDRLAVVEHGKPLQLRDAAAAGLPVPATLIATHGHTVNTWMPADTPCIYKAFRAPYRPQGAVREPGWVLATRVREPLPEDLCAASTFQHLVEGTPVRVTVIGTKLFAVEITGVDYDVDWRPQQTNATLRPVPVPDSVEQAIHTLMSRWGLTYGAFDFIAAPRREWVFLEVNPTGAYGFVEEATGLPLTATIVETLINGRQACRR